MDMHMDMHMHMDTFVMWHEAQARRRTRTSSSKTALKPLPSTTRVACRWLCCGRPWLAYKIQIYKLQNHKLQGYTYKLKVTSTNYE